MIEFAAVLIGAGLLLSYSSRSNKMKAEFLEEATQQKELKGLEEILVKKPFNQTVVVFGTVGSTSSVATNHTGTLGVFIEETASVYFERMNCVGSAPDYEDTMLDLKEVPWYLEDSTARVNVKDYQYAKGFNDILEKYFYTVPVSKHFASLFSVKEIKIPDLNRCECCEQVLKIGTPLTIVGRVGRDKDGAPMLGCAYQVFNERIELKDLISDLKSISVYYDNFSLYLTAIGVALLVVSVLQDD